jgi:hydrogenase maturation protein HypF
VAFHSPSVSAFDDHERSLLIDAMARAINAPVTTSAGRLFDAIASLAGLRQVSNFEGQAAMDLEFAITPAVDESYRFAIVDGAAFSPGSWQPPSFVIDWAPMLHEIIRDMRTGVAAGVIAARAHNALVDVIVAAALRVGVPAVVLTGGCFQNRYLTERTVNRLRSAGFRPYWHQRVPPNDGGISLGQIAVYRRAKENLTCALPFPDASSASSKATPSFAAAGSISRA